MSPLRRRALSACGLAAAFLCLTVAPASAVEEKLNVTHLYNQAHSLTGGCAVSSKDEVPDPACTETPPGPLSPEGPLAGPTGVAVDAYGDQYVVNRNESTGEGTSQIDIFDPTGHYIGGFNVNEHFAGGFASVGPTESVAVDSTGHLYASTGVSDMFGAFHTLVRYDPTVYDPEAGEIEYGSTPVVVNKEGGSPGLAVDPANDHLYVNQRQYVVEYTAATDGAPNEVLSEEIGKGVLGEGFVTGMVAVDAQRGRIYVTDEQGGEEFKVKVDALSASPPYQLLGSVDGSETPANAFTGQADTFGLAVDEASGDFFVAYQNRVYELSADGTYVATVRKPTQESYGGAGIAYDNGPHSPNQGYLYVSTGFAVGHLYAYEPFLPPRPPAIEATSFSGVGEKEAVLHATVNPEGEPTHYAFELTTQQDFEEEGFAAAVTVGEGQLGTGGEGVAVSATAEGLSSGSAYRFRVVAENQCEAGGCRVEAQRELSTFPAYVQSSACPNQALRGGASARLPDCRAYELVTPANTGGRAPAGPALGGPAFATANASAGGQSVIFTGIGGAFPGFDVPGNFRGDGYVSRRGPGGWSTEPTGLTGAQAPAEEPGGLSADHGFAAVGAFGFGAVGGSLVEPGGSATYVRYPDGSIHLAGEGSIGEAKNVGFHYIAAHGTHIVFNAGGSASAENAVQLEPDAPPAGTSAIFDRTPDSTLHVASLLPGDVTPALGRDAKYEGVSTDGSTIAFRLTAKEAPESPFYLRLDDAETVEATVQAISNKQLACQPGSNLAGATPSYEWLLDGAPIPGASSATYTPEPGQAGSVLQCEVRAANAEGGARAVSDALVIDEARAAGPPPRPFSAVGSLPASPAIGDVLECKPGIWSPADTEFAFQWYRDGDPIGGATAGEYEVQAGDARSRLQCAVTASASDTATLAFSASSEPTPPKPPAVSASPAIANLTHPETAPVAGDGLSCGDGNWSNAPSFSYRWLRNGTPIPGATAATYTVVAEDEGTALQCEVSAANADGTAVALSAASPVAPLASASLPGGNLQVKGTRAVGNTLECDAGTWQGSPTFSYEWTRNGSPIPGATTATYTLTAADRETVVQCVLAAAATEAAVLAISGGFVNANPQPVAEAAGLTAAFAGLSAEGRYLFYLLGGDLYRYDSRENTTERLTETGDAIPAYLSEDGSIAYFVSDADLSAGPNPRGEEAQAGAPNLYQWREGTIRFLATVTEEDVTGEVVSGFNHPVGGFAEWMRGIDASGRLPLRATADGQTLLFSSSSDLTGFQSGAKKQVYRYDSAAESLSCLSCDPTQARPGSDASLLTDAETVKLRDGIEGVTIPSAISIVPNLSADGKRAFFESTERLVPADEDHLRDVYEWEAQGEGTCEEPGGCIFLISSGKSGRENYLYGVSETGDDVFFSTSDILNSEDAEEAPSIYDAKVGGGFAPTSAAAAECQGEACQPAAVAPDRPTAGVLNGKGNVSQEGKAKSRCPKGKRKLRRPGKRHCVPRHKKRHHKRANHRRRAGR